MANIIPATMYFNNLRDFGIFGEESITFDLIISESHSFQSNVSEYNIEDGSKISDHIQNELLEAECSGIISNFSIQQAGSLVTNRAQDIFEKLESIWSSKKLVTVATVHRMYENVVLTEIGISRDENTGEVLNISLSFKEIKIVTLQALNVEASIKLKDMSSNTNKQSSKKKVVGKK